jgi:hypothetical protein
MEISGTLGGAWEWGKGRGWNGGAARARGTKQGRRWQWNPPFRNPTLPQPACPATGASPHPGLPPTCSMMPANAQKRTMWSGTPTASSWNTADTKNTRTVAQYLGGGGGGDGVGCCGGTWATGRWGQEGQAGSGRARLGGGQEGLGAAGRGAGAAPPPSVSARAPARGARAPPLPRPHAPADPRAHRGEEDGAQQELVDGHVPGAPVLAHRGGVPKVLGAGGGGGGGKQ